ncbi:unnamed protein product [Paramecium pentaurelia]|uniref:Transmembrane protein n=1 Tax=Paramecium pentaurelia TaxID=43138 RepID=A0A8S1TUS3_9CILI|nr:unnamed protein product [Paramecium pentaurelia]
MKSQLVVIKLLYENETSNKLKTNQELQIYNIDEYQLNNVINMIIQSANQSIFLNSRISNQTCAFIENFSQFRSKTCDDLLKLYYISYFMQLIESQCTTNGIDYIIFGQCSTHRTAYIGLNTQGVKICILDQRDKFNRGIKCSNFYSRTNLDCKQQLSECITNSNICILGDPCDEYTYLNYCIQSKNQLCLWIQNSCINYSKCEDAKLKTFYECQIVAPFCTSNIQNIYHLLFVLNMKMWKPVYLVGINYGNEMKMQILQNLLIIIFVDQIIMILYLMDINVFKQFKNLSNNLCMDQSIEGSRIQITKTCESIQNTFYMLKSKKLLQSQSNYLIFILKKPQQL